MSVTPSHEENVAELLPIVIVTGLSGSGKSTALGVFEDMGFFTVDGLPAEFVSQIVTMITNENQAGNYSGIALGMDLRQNDFKQNFDKSLLSLKQQGFSPKIVFFEAKTEILLKRYATTRRPHPLEKREGLGLEQALQIEKNRLRHLRKTADLVIDTSSHSIHDLRRVLQKKWNSLRQASKSLRVHIITFGFKYGMPSEADMVFDLRFLPNPFFVPELKAQSGLDQAVAEYVLEQDPGKTFFIRLMDFLHFVLEQSDAEGRFRTTIAIGCTGGRHRSVAVAEALAKELKKQDYVLSLEHRHLELG